MTDDSSPARLTERYRSVLTTQSYRPRRTIDGVKVVELVLHSDEGGDFCEIARLADGALLSLPDYRPAQLSYSYLEPGTIKAWHIHCKQDDLWFIPPVDRLLVGLYDVRSDSASEGAQMRLAMGAGKARLLRIPRGVAHGAANLSPHGATIIYFTDQAFNAEEPDEHRLPFDVLGADFWSIKPA